MEGPIVEYKASTRHKGSKVKGEIQKKGEVRGMKL